MPAPTEHFHRIRVHPLHAACLAATVALFLGALLTDIAYANTYHVQWQNFASWLVVAALAVGAVPLAWAVVDLFRDRRRAGRALAHAVVVVAMWVVGVFDALVHGKDAWAMMPGGLVLSAVALVLAVVATWLGFSAPRGVPRTRVVTSPRPEAAP